MYQATEKTTGQVVAIKQIDRSKVRGGEGRGERGEREGRKRGERGERGGERVVI